MEKKRIARHISTFTNRNYVIKALEKRWPTYEFVGENKTISVYTEPDDSTKLMRAFACGAIAVVELIDCE